MPLLLPQFRDAGDSQTTVESSWRGTRSVTDAEGQTDPIATSHQRTQEPRVQEAESQTAPVDEGTQTADLAPSQPNRFVGDSAHLNAFLHESTAALEEQMLRNLATSAFDGHTVSWEEEHDQVSCLHSLKHRGVLASTAPEACSALAWNAGGTVLAAAYGPLDRTDWASQSSMLCTWSVFRRQLDPAKADLALELQECLPASPSTPRTPRSSRAAPSTETSSCGTSRPLRTSSWASRRCATIRTTSRCSASAGRRTRCTEGTAATCSARSPPTARC